MYINTKNYDKEKILMGKKSKTFKKAIALILAMALVSVASVMGTLAVLKAQTEGLTNTFVATKSLMDDNSKFKITETAQDGHTVVTDGEGTTFSITPLATIEKDPKVTTGTFLTDGVVFVEVLVQNNSAMIGGEATALISFSVDSSVWVDTGEKGVNGGNLYVYKAGEDDYVVDKDAALADVEIIAGNTVTVTDYTDEDNVTAQPTVIFYAYAIQSLYKTAEATATVNSVATAYEAWDVQWNSAE